MLNSGNRCWRTAGEPSIKLSVVNHGRIRGRFLSSPSGELSRVVTPEVLIDSDNLLLTIPHNGRRYYVVPTLQVNRGFAVSTGLIYLNLKLWRILSQVLLY